MSKVVPEGWTFDELGEYISQSIAGEWGTEAIGDDNDIPVLRSTNFTSSGIIDYSNLAYRNIEERKRLAKGLKLGDIVLEKSGGSPTQPVGRVVYFDRNDPFLFSNFTQKLTPKLSCDSKFLFYKLYFEYQNGTVLKFQQQTTGIINFQLAEYLRFKSIFPPLAEQQKIATILTSVDNVIEKTRAQIDKLKDLKTGMMQELFTKGIGHTEFKDSPVGRIPISWKAMPLGTVCELEVGYAFKSEWFSDSGVRLLRGDNVGYGIPTWERIQYLAEEQAKSYSRYLLDVDDVVIGMDRTFTQSGAKITKIRSSDVPALLVQRVGKFVPEKYTMKFLWQLVRSSAFIEGLKAQEKGMDIPHLSKNEILSCVVVLPPFKEQEEIADILEAQDILIECEREKLAALEEMKRALMQDLLLGEVRVG